MNRPLVSRPVRQVDRHAGGTGRRVVPDFAGSGRTIMILQADPDTNPGDASRGQKDGQTQEAHSAIHLVQFFDGQQASAACLVQ